MKVSTLLDLIKEHMDLIDRIYVSDGTTSYSTNKLEHYYINVGSKNIVQCRFVPRTNEKDLSYLYILV